MARKRHPHVKREPRPRGVPLSFFIIDDPAAPVTKEQWDIVDNQVQARILKFTQRRTVCRWPEDKRDA